MSYTSEGAAQEVVTIDPAADSTCAQLPGPAQIIRHARETYRQFMVEDCPRLEQLLQSGVTEIEGRAIDRAALAKYLTEDCGNIS